MTVERDVSLATEAGLSALDIARNIVDEFPDIPPSIRPTLRDEIHGALAYEQETAAIEVLATERATAAVDVERHTFVGSAPRCRVCNTVRSNRRHRPRLKDQHRPLGRAVESITPEEMVDALLDVRLGVEGSDAVDQRQSTRYYAERLLARLSGESE